jgi:trimethylamine--corrinoid protein Co-methyltransferase
LLNHFQHRVQPAVRFLTKEQAAEIHLAALGILERTGIQVHLSEVVDILAEAGCQVMDNKTVSIPPHIVEEALRRVPSKVNMFSRQRQLVMTLEDRKSYWGTGSDTPFIRDTFSGERRRTNLQDVEKATRIVDACDNMDFHMCMGVAHELPQNIADKHHFFAMLKNTSKPLIFTASSVENLKDMHDMAGIVAGSTESLRSTPFIMHYTEPIAPLIHPADSLEKLLYCLDHGIPVIYTSATTAGQNGPVTLAGSLAMSVARVVSGLVIGQLRNPGAKMIVTFHVSAMDPKTAIHPYASPEHVIGQAAAKDMALFYGIPTFGRAGCTDSKILDQQAGFEAGYEILMQALCGENLIHDVGYLESGLTASWDCIVMSNEFIGAAKRVADGFELSDETLALDLIHQIGPSGHFLAEEHTATHFRREIWLPELIDRDNFERWSEQGATSLLDRIRDRVKHILENHIPDPLDDALMTALVELANKDNS